MTQEGKIFAVVCSILIGVVATLGVSLFRANKIIDAQGDLVQSEREYISTLERLVSVQDDIMDLQTKVNCRYDLSFCRFSSE